MQAGVAETTDEFQIVTCITLWSGTIDSSTADEEV